MCKRTKEPYKDMYNLVGGKIEKDDDGLNEAYRELFEETGISKNDVELVYFMNLSYIKWNKELELSKKIYNNHKNLILVAREKVSYELMRKDFNKCKIIITPDIVLYLNECANRINRSGALFCLRSDLESKINYDNKQCILQMLKSEYKEINVTDTGIDKFIKKEERKQFFYEKLDEFKEAELVITDRIHGMIFAAITGTPCIALSNYNYKVKGTYEWIKGLNYIKFTDDIEKIPELIDELKKLNNITYDNSDLMKYYNKIIKCIAE